MYFFVTDGEMTITTLLQRALFVAYCTFILIGGTVVCAC